MPAPQYQQTHEIVIAATLWLMHRYQQNGCTRPDRMVEQRLRWMQADASSPTLAKTCQRLSVEWQALSGAVPFPPSILH